MNLYNALECTAPTTAMQSQEAMESSSLVYRPFSQFDYRPNGFRPISYHS